jgi:hypothetical protein
LSREAQPAESSQAEWKSEDGDGAKVNHVNAETAQEAPEVMLGTFSVNSISATILFYSGASHSFILKHLLEIIAYL